MIESILRDPRCDFVSAEDKAFVTAFTRRMEALGYSFGGQMHDGICFGRYMFIFRRANVKSTKVYARIYLRNSGAVLRLFLSNVSAHAAFIEQAPDYIREAFTGPYAACTGCRGETCRFRKSYTIAGTPYDKCNGLTFEFFQPTVARIDGYLALFNEFYGRKGR